MNYYYAKTLLQIRYTDQTINAGEVLDSSNLHSLGIDPEDTETVSEPFDTLASCKAAAREYVSNLNSANRF